VTRRRSEPRSQDGNRRRRVPRERSKEGGPLPVNRYRNNLNHAELTSGRAGPKCGGPQLATGLCKFFYELRIDIVLVENLNDKL